MGTIWVQQRLNDTNKMKSASNDTYIKNDKYERNGKSCENWWHTIAVAGNMGL